MGVAVCHLYIGQWQKYVSLENTKQHQEISLPQLCSKPFPHFDTVPMAVVIYIFVSDCLHFTQTVERKKNPKIRSQESWKKNISMAWKYEKGWKDNWSFREKQIIHDHQTKVFCQIGAHDPECFLKVIACKLSNSFCIGKYMAEGTVKNYC